ncbi:MAG: alpha/beta hydrolase [Candidatus Eremiobacteraeota bacterium]|nr:alpha/beta hydrolase [Candidatus Eremiobacteraeota bacterium]
MNATGEDLTLHHKDSDRAVPVRRYSAETEPEGWILFSVGFGGDRNGYGFFARTWAAAGFTTFVVEHVGSNLDVLRSFPQKRKAERNAEVVRRVGDPEELRARPRDLALVWQHLREEFEGLPLGLAGHSYGSYTVLACTGMEPSSTTHGVESIPATGYLVISPQPPGMLFSTAEYEKVRRPVLVMTGTEDHLLSGESDYSDRLDAYKFLPEAFRRLVVFRGFEHMDFAGVGLNLGHKLEAMNTVSRLWWQGLVAEELEAWPAKVRASVGAEVLEVCE